MLFIPNRPGPIPSTHYPGERNFEARPQKYGRCKMGELLRGSEAGDSKFLRSSISDTRLQGRAEGAGEITSQSQCVEMNDL